jgi:ATP-binding cassette subfamily B multidrug efflux pump
MPINNFREDEVMKDKINSTTILRLFAYLKPHVRMVVQTLFLMGVAMAVELFNPYFLKLGIDEYIENGDGPGILMIGGVMIALNLGSMYCARFRMIKMAGVSNDILLTIRQQLYAHIQKLSFSFFDSRPVGKVLARIIGDVNSLNDLFTNSVTSLIPEVVKVIAVIAIMLLMNWRLALVSLVTLPFMMLVMVLISRASHKGWQLFRKKASNMNAFTHEDFSGIRVVQSFAAEKETSKTFWTLVTDWRKAFISAVKFADFFWPSVEMSWGVGTIVVFSYGLALINTGTITVGLLVAFSGYIGMFWQPVMNLSNFYNQLVTNITGAERIFEILDIRPDIADREGCAELPPIQGNVSFKHVTFGYETAKPVLKDVSFQVRAGETIALVGPTGVGKTTIVNLISRFYETQSGEVSIDGHDVTKVSIESLRSQMGIMMQDSFLFSGTIRDNIRYGRLDATDEEIESAAATVQAHEFILKFEKGYDTDVNERGARLSGGQRQLIAFARALLANPRILILDEATASIDTHTEKLVQEGIKKLLKGRTSFVIAHRLSTIQSADRIMVIENGDISECGTHDELMQSQGAYWQLFMAQFKFLHAGEAVS